MFKRVFLTIGAIASVLLFCHNVMAIAPTKMRISYLGNIEGAPCLQVEEPGGKIGFVCDYQNGFDL